MRSYSKCLLTLLLVNSCNAFNSFSHGNKKRNYISDPSSKSRTTPLFVSTFPSTSEKIADDNPEENLNISSEKTSFVEEVELVVGPTTKSYLDDGFIFGLDDSGIERPKGKVSQVVVEGDGTETTPFQVSLVLSTFIFHLLLIAMNTAELSSMNGGDIAKTAIQFTALLASSWISADFGSGVLHWSVDNYGNGRTPIMGNIIAAFQGHHAAPWTITERGFCNNVHKLCIPFGIPTMTLINFISGPSTTIFFAFFCMAEILSQEFHKWAHTTKNEVPSYVNTLQKIGVSIARTQHANHHRQPYAGNYCIVSGLCNEALDNSCFFRRLEHVVYNLNGIESNSWKLDAKLRERTLSGDYTLKK